MLQALAAFQQGSSQLLFAEPCSLKFFSVEQGLKPGDELVAGEHKGASAAAAELVGAELGHEFVGLASLNLEDLFDNGAIDDRGGKTLDLSDNVGQAVKPSELWRQDRTSAATDPQGGYLVGGLSLTCVRRDIFSRNLSEDVSARSGTRTRAVTSYNVRYGVLPCFPTFFTVLFPYAPKSRKATRQDTKNRGKPRNRRSSTFPCGSFPAFHLFGGYHERALRAPAPSGDHNG